MFNHVKIINKNRYYVTFCDKVLADLVSVGVVLGLRVLFKKAETHQFVVT